MTLPVWLIITIIVILVILAIARSAIIGLFAVLLRRLSAWVDVIAASADADAALRTARQERKAAGIRSGTAKIDAATDQLRADAAVAAGLVEPRIVAETRVIDAAADARVAAIQGAKASSRVKRPRTGPGVLYTIRRAFGWLPEVLVPALVIAGVFGLAWTYNQDHHRDVLVCGTFTTTDSDGPHPAISTSTGDYGLDTGFYGQVYYSKLDGISSYFQKGGRYRITYHGYAGWYHFHYVTRADPLPSNGETCAT